MMSDNKYTGTTKDRQLLELLDEVITRNKAEYDIEDGNNEELNGKDNFEGESEHAVDDDLEDKNTNKNENEVVDKSDSLDLESRTHTLKQMDTAIVMRKLVDNRFQYMMLQKLIETGSINVDHDVCTQKRHGVNDKESDCVVTSTVVDQHDGQGNPDNWIVIEPSQDKQ